MLVAPEVCNRLTSFGFFLPVERDLVFSFSISEQVVSDVTITWANY